MIISKNHKKVVWMTEKTTIHRGWYRKNSLTVYDFSYEYSVHSSLQLWMLMRKKKGRKLTDQLVEKCVIHLITWSIEARSDFAREETGSRLY